MYDLIERVYYNILTNNNKIYKLKKILRKLSVLKDETINCFLNDKRFKIIKNDKEYLINIDEKYKIDIDEYQLTLIYLWKHRIIRYLKENNNVNINRLAKIIKRQKKLLKIFDLSDILIFDHDERFTISSQYVKYNLISEKKLNYYLVLNYIEKYLKLKNNKLFSLVNLEHIVKKSLNFDENKKLIDIIKEDKRFEIIFNGNYNNLIKIRLFNNIQKNNIIPFPPPGFNNLNCYKKPIGYERETKLKFDFILDPLCSNYV